MELYAHGMPVWSKLPEARSAGRSSRFHSVVETAVVDAVIYAMVEIAIVRNRKAAERGTNDLRLNISLQTCRAWLLSSLLREPDLRKTEI